MRIVHAADIHLDSPLRGLMRLGDEDVARQLRLASRRALENLVAMVVTEGAQALVIAGDTYDGDWQDYATGRFFSEQMAVLEAHGIPVFMASGNHDAESQITRTLRLPPNVNVLSTDAPETVCLDDLGLAIHGQGYATRAVTQNLARAYPQRVPNLVNVGILHTAVAGAEGHETYAPCTPEDLERAEYDYFALGHVHQGGVINNGHHVAAFSGNLQGRHPKETGAKGALVIDVEPDGRAQLRHVPLDVARWMTIDVDVTGFATFDDVLEDIDQKLADAATTTERRLLVARVEIAGETQAAGALTHREDVYENVANLAARHRVTIERVRSRATAPSDQQSVDPELLVALQNSAPSLAELRDMAKPLATEVGRSLRAGPGINLDDDIFLQELAKNAIDDLVARLAGEGN
ncbi:DNA repair exonuclease [Arthrobacter echini]|uniref:DNA repair exonuclease n=2 Tax=Arthrobacter echini TaxID=1529066 RepID=A0A4S5E2T3_9MICC|nr:DNA repair exonuclease [Arthrobacter echini]THJ65660.1 DNA repair exonuclease [Arthrobacter echini]TYC95964.1 DNA repair exonuclease [Arthrobacter echini]